MAEDFKALADPIRLRLLSLIASVPEGEAGRLRSGSASGSESGTVSHHLSVLTKVGLITREQRGKWAWFQVAPERGDFVRSILDQSAVPVS